MAWIKTVRPEEGDDRLRRRWKPSTPCTRSSTPRREPSVNADLPGIVASHSLIPEALHHAFSTFGALMSPDLPLVRRQHEMIATVVSLTNRCRY